jgi:hypothetical protein
MEATDAAAVDPRMRALLMAIRCALRMLESAIDEYLGMPKRKETSRP